MTCRRFVTPGGTVDAVKRVRSKSTRAKRWRWSANRVGQIGDGAVDPAIAALSGRAAIRTVPSGSRAKRSSAPVNPRCARSAATDFDDFPGADDLAQSRCTRSRSRSESLILHKGMSDTAARARVLELFNLVGVRDAEQRLSAYPHEIVRRAASAGDDRHGAGQ